MFRSCAILLRSSFRTCAIAAQLVSYLREKFVAARYYCVARFVAARCYCAARFVAPWKFGIRSSFRSYAILLRSSFRSTVKKSEFVFVDGEGVVSTVSDLTMGRWAIDNQRILFHVLNVVLWCRMTIAYSVQSSLNLRMSWNIILENSVSEVVHKDNKNVRVQTKTSHYTTINDSTSLCISLGSDKPKEIYCLTLKRERMMIVVVDKFN